MTKVVCPPPPRRDGGLRDAETLHVRVTGLAYTAGHYGHLSMSDGVIQATEIVFLDPKRPQCK